MEINHNERVVLGHSPQNVINEHISRYRFAEQYAVGLRCLDIACGTGYGSRLLKDAGALYVLGGDIAEDCVSLASVAYGDIDGLTFRKIDAAAMELDSGSFDLVVSFETFEHLLEPHLFLAEAYRVLTPGGKMIMSTPNALYSCFPYGFLSAKRRRPNNRFHTREWTIGEIARLAGKKFKVQAIYGQGGKNTLPFIALTLAAVIAPWQRLKIYQFWKVRTKDLGNDIFLLNSWDRIPKFSIWILEKSTSA